MSEDEEDAGLDIVEHGMYGYPEQFITSDGGPSGVSSAPAPATLATATRPDEVTA